MKATQEIEEGKVAKTKKELLADLKEIQDKCCELCLKKNVITKEEFEKITEKLYKWICNFKNEIEKIKM